VANGFPPVSEGPGGGVSRPPFVGRLPAGAL
jgi:hypothetical protein